MHFGAEDSIVLLGLLAAGAALLAIAQVVRVPYPILLVLGGLALGFIPGMPTIELSPDLVLVAFLPPLLYGAAFFTPLRELRANAGSISTLAVGLVLATTVAVAVVAHAVIPELTWPTAFVLGAIVSPTDPTAATAIAQRLGLPRRLIAIIEGESLVNDGTGLVVYRVAVVAVVAGSFSLASASARFVLSVIGGILVGLAAGIVIRQVRRRLNNPPVEITISILSGYFAYLPAHALDVSGVLAAVTVGVYMGWYTPELTTSQTRLQGQAVWEIVFLGLNAVLFALIGLQLPAILDELSAARSTGELLGYAALVTTVVVLVRFAWVVRRRLHAADDACRRRPAVEGRRRPLLVRHARRRVTRRRPGAPADNRRGRSVPQPRPDRLPHLRRDPRHARRSGPDAARPDSLARPRGRPPRRKGGGEGADPGCGGRTRAAGRAGGRGLGEPGHGRADARPVRLPPRPVPISVRPGERRRDREPIARATSGCAASSSRPSARSSASSGWKAASTTTSCAGCSATSISRTSGSTSRPPASSPAAA